MSAPVKVGWAGGIGSEHHLTGAVERGVHAEDLAAISVGDQLQCAAGVLVGQRAWDVLRAQHSTVTRVPSCQRLFLGQAGLPAGWLGGPVAPSALRGAGSL